MIAKFEFNLPEDQEQYNIFQKAPELHSLLWDLDQWLRALQKYEDKEVVKIDEIREKIGEVLE